MPKISEIEIWEFLRAIESGSVVLTPNEDPQVRYTGNITYQASNGWRIVIFNDCNEWDYIDEIVTSDGRRISYSVMCNWFPALGEYTPSDEIVWSKYGIDQSL